MFFFYALIFLLMPETASSFLRPQVSMAGDIFWWVSPWKWWNMAMFRYVELVQQCLPRTGWNWMDTMKSFFVAKICKVNQYMEHIGKIGCCGMSYVSPDRKRNISQHWSQHIPFADIAAWLKNQVSHWDNDPSSLTSQHQAPQSIPREQVRGLTEEELYDELSGWEDLGYSQSQNTNIAELLQSTHS